MFGEPDEHQEIRDAVRQLCRQYPDEYFRAVDAQKAYPQAFVDGGAVLASRIISSECCSRDVQTFWPLTT